MKIIKRLLIGIIGFIALLLIAGLFVKKDFNVEREITINKHLPEVFNYVKYLKNQNNYSKWAAIDPKMKSTYTGEDAAVGFVSAWESDNEEVGVGEQEITNINENNSIEYKIRFKTPFESESDAFMKTEAVSETQTKVKWGFSGSMPYPFNLMGLFMNMEKEVGNDLQIGLNNLKILLEKN